MSRSHSTANFSPTTGRGAILLGWRSTSVRELALTALFVFACTLPVLFLTTPPMTDVLGHMGRYAIQTGLADMPWLASFYTFHWQIIGNLGADVLVEALAPRFGIERATQIVILLNQFLASAGILWLSREIHGRTTPFAVLALPLIYAVPFTYGFLNFTLSMALALHAFGLWLRLEQKGRGRLRTVLFVPLGLLVWICHTFGWAFLGLLCTAHSFAMSEAASRSWYSWPRDAASRCWPLLAPLAPMLIWRGGAASAGLAGWFDPLEKMAWAIAFLRLDWPMLDRLSAVVLLLVLYIGLRSPRVAVNRTMFFATGLGLIAYLLLPKQVFGSFYADMRLVPYVIMSGLLALGRIEGEAARRRLIGVAAFSFLTLRLTLTGVTYYERERDLQTHLAALSAIPERARLATLVQLPCQNDWEMPWLTHLGSMALVRRHVFTNDQWATSGMNLLSVHYPLAGGFATDKAEIVYPDSCAQGENTMDRAMAHLPLNAFTHLWVIEPAPDRLPARASLVPIWRSRDAVVFAVDARLQRQSSDRH